LNKKEKSVIQDTGERMIPQFHRGKLMYAEHYARYECANAYTKGMVVLDIACGSGYGTKMMAKNARKVFGVDIDPATIDYARANFSAENIEYLVGDGVDIPVDTESIDVVVTFETIEHIADYKKFIAEIRRVLKPDGVVIVSTPNDLEFAEGNAFHVHEFEQKELLSAFERNYKYIDKYYQATWKYVALGKEQDFKTEGSFPVPTLNLSPVTAERCLYFYFVCSNKELNRALVPMGILGEHYSDREIVGQQQHAEQLLSDHRSVIEGLKVELTDVKKAFYELKEENDKIRDSKSFKFANKLSRLKQKFKV
jgi:2-polyprenyl-3-methyl-5-hydroxy-6-metoxy-1,4-benzoquinol methylase